MNILAFVLAVIAIILFWAKPIQYGLTALVVAWVVQLVWPAHSLLIR